MSPNEKRLYEFASLHVASAKGPGRDIKTDVASAQGHKDCVVEFLLDRNAVPRKVILKGDMPLHKAPFSGHRKIVEIVEVFLNKIGYLLINNSKYPNGESLLIASVRKFGALVGERRI